MNNIENFKKEFKIYCETVEDTKGLEAIKDVIFGDVLNLETFIDDFVDKKTNKCWRDISNDEQVKLAKLAAKELARVSEEAEKINNTDLRELWKIINDLSYSEIKGRLEFLLNDLFWILYSKKYPNDHSLLRKYDLKDEDFEKWYTDLFNLLEKYDLLS